MAGARTAAASPAAPAEVNDTDDVPAFDLRGGDPRDQLAHGMAKETHWFNQYFYTALLAQYGIDPSAVFPALSASGSAAGEPGGLAACDPAKGAIATIVNAMLQLPWALLAFAVLLRGAQQRLRDPFAPRDLVRGLVTDGAVALGMALTVAMSTSGPISRILLTYAAVNITTALTRAAVFGTAPAAARAVACPVDPDEPASAYYCLEDSAKSGCPADIHCCIQWRGTIMGFGREAVAQAIFSATVIVRTCNRLFVELVLLEFADQDVESASTWWALGLSTALLLLLSTRAMYTGYPWSTEWWFGYDALACVLLFGVAWQLRCAEPAISLVILLYALCNCTLVMARCTFLCESWGALPRHTIPAALAFVLIRFFDWTPFGSLALIAPSIVAVWWVPDLS